MQATPLTFNGFTFTLFEGDGISETVRSGKAWEPHVLELFDRLITPGSVVCDAGANFGFHTVHLARKVGAKGLVLAFEPQRIVFQQLCFHIFANSIPNVAAYPLALGNVYGRTRIGELHEVVGKNIGQTTVGTGSHIVDVFPLDHFAHLPISFIKIDVQGLESSLLEGATAVFEKNRPLLCIEIEEMWLKHHKSSSKTLIESLFAKNYSLLKIESEWPTDHLAFPREKREQVNAALDGYGFKTTLIEGSTIDLTFGDKPFYESYKITS